MPDNSQALFNFAVKSNIMKRRYIVIYTLVVLLLSACAGKKEDAHGHAAGEEGDWKEMDEFHMIMAETFHPYKDSSNLDPAKARAAELATAAGKWAGAALPGKVDNDEIRSKLQRLKSETEALSERVRTADDNIIAEQLTKVHDTFHEIQEAWYGSH